MADRGAFKLGKVIDPATGKPGADDLVIGSSDLTTHGVIVGMTGSGKTGLAVVLLEEALLAGIPALILDPKGDMANLALTFPDLAPTSFQPWVNASDAQAEGITVEQLAEKTATTWRDGLAAQGIGPERIQQLRDAADVTVYTPGSSAGVPLNVIGSLRAPGLSWDTEAETLRDEIEGTVTSLLGLVGVTADPLSSREHVLLSNLIENAWRAGRDLDLGMLIGEIQSPPLRKLGVFEIDAFFPPADRTALALKLNALIASPAFAAWGEGAPLDPQTLLFTPEGKPRAAIIYLAHLSDEERMFVTTLVFSKLVTWMRGQSGTSGPPRTRLHGRGRGVRAADGGATGEEADPDDLQAGARIRARARPLDPEPGRSRLQGDGERGHLARRAAADRERQGARARGPALCGGRRRHRRARRFDRCAAEAPVHARLGEGRGSTGLRHPLGDVVPARAADEGGGGAVDERRSASGRSARRDRCGHSCTRSLRTRRRSRPQPLPASPSRTSILRPPGRRRSARPAAAASLRAFVATRVALRYDDTAAGIDEAQEFEALYGPLDAGLRSRRRDGRRLRRP